MNRLSAILDINSFDQLKELEKWIVNDTLILLRTREMEASYQERRKEVIESGLTYEAAVAQDFFHKEYVVDPYYGVFLVPNRFPVMLPNDTEHWNIWFQNAELAVNSSVEVLERVMQIKGWQFEDIIYWEKTKGNKSVPGIHHIHIFARKFV